MSFANGNVHFNQTWYFDLRSSVCSLSSLLPSIIYLTCRFFGLSQVSSVFSAVLVLTDPTIAIEGRLILTDGILHTFSSLALLGLANLSLSNSVFSLILCGVSLGMAFSVKYTSFGLSILVATHEYFRIFGFNLFGFLDSSDHIENVAFFQTNIGKLIKNGVIISLSSFAVLILAFITHVIVIKYRVSQESMISSNYEESLLWNWEKDQSRRVIQMGLLERVFQSIFRMHEINMNSFCPIGIESKWYEWPLILCDSLVYYAKELRAIWMIPNPFVWYTASIGTLLLFLLIAFSIFKGDTYLIKYLFLPIGYLTSLVPFALIKRTTYLYHYIIPLILGVINASVFLNLFLHKNIVIKNSIFVIIMFCSITEFVFLSPFTFVLPNYFMEPRLWRNNLLK